LSEFEILLEKLLQQKPEISRVQIEESIKQKKEKIGAGYLTDQGALFLVASDFGISLSDPLRVEMGLKDLYVGAKEISLETRMLNLSPAKQFSRKDGSTFFLRIMTVYDSDSTASVKLWDEKANLPGIENLKPGDLIKIIKAYVKSDLKGSPTINVGSGSNIEQSESQSEIPSIDSITLDVSLVKDDQNDLVVTGSLEGAINFMEFTNSRGGLGKALRLRLKGKDGNSTRVVLWGKDHSDLPKIIPPNANVKLLGVRTKSGNQGLEIHGSDATMIQIEGKQEIEPITLRLISISKNELEKVTALGVDNKKEMLYIDDSAKSINQFNVGDVIELMPSKIYGNSIIVDNDSFVRKIESDKSIPNLSELRTKISDVKSGDTYCIEAIILKIPDRREIQTKSGESVLLSEMFVEDDSGQIWIKGWRNQAKLVDQCSLGEIISVTGVNAKEGLEGRIELSLTPFSIINRKN